MMMIGAQQFSLTRSPWWLPAGSRAYQVPMPVVQKGGGAISVVGQGGP